MRLKYEEEKREKGTEQNTSHFQALRQLETFTQWGVCDSLFQRLQSTVEVSQTHVSFLTIGQKDEGTRRDQQEDKDDDKDNDKGKGTDT